MTKARTLADMISDGVIGTTELADDVITPVKLDETGSYSMAQLGVGTASPAKRFHISTTTGTDLFRLSGVNSFNFDIESSGTGNQFDFRIGSGGGAYTFNNSNRELVKFDASGNVILNSTSVSTSDNIALRITGGSSGYSNVQFADAGDVNVGMIQYNHASNYMQLTTNDSERMRITSSGDVGIGTSSPNTMLHVKSPAFTDSTIHIDATSNNVSQRIDFRAAGTLTSRIYDDATKFELNAVANKYMRFLTNNTERMRVRNDGNIHVNTTTPDLVGNTTSLSIGGSSFGGDGMLSLQSGWGGTTYGRVFASGGTLKIGNPQSSNVELFTANLTRLKIDASGRVTKPYQPSFYAFRQGANYNAASSGWEKMVLDGTRWNTGSHYSTTTQRFTAPVDGVYHFSVNVNRYGVNDDLLLAVALYVNGSVYVYGNRFHSRGTTDLVASMSSTIKLSANDHVEPWSYSNDAVTGFSSGANWNTFSGHLVG